MALVCKGMCGISDTLGVKECVSLVTLVTMCGISDTLGV